MFTSVCPSFSPSLVGIWFGSLLADGNLAVRCPSGVLPSRHHTSVLPLLISVKLEGLYMPWQAGHGQVSHKDPNSSSDKG